MKKMEEPKAPNLVAANKFSMLEDEASSGGSEQDE